MITWQFFPKSDPEPAHLRQLVAQFQHHASEIDSVTHDLKSDEVLATVRPDLVRLGYDVEMSKLAADKLKVPVLFGRDGSIEKYFDADARHTQNRTVLEIEAGRGVANNQFLKDLFQACMMVEVDFLAVAVRNLYKGSNDFERVVRFFDTLYASRRLELPLRGILVLGY